MYTETLCPAAGFEHHRARLERIAHRMLGSAADAEDAVQETWLRARHTDPGQVHNLGAWLTTVLARVCLDILRARRARPELLFDHEPPEHTAPSRPGPEHEVAQTDQIGTALLVIWHRLGPAERIAFVLHDLFAVPFDEIGRRLDRSPIAARQLASRARRRVRDCETPVVNRHQQRTMAAAFVSASSTGDFDPLIALLAEPDAARGTARSPRRPIALGHAHHLPADQPAATTDAGRRERRAVA
ncbi:sigma-70 family RNA polymerase sigma factor [Nocardia sp. NBC_00511]|uniref:sigma-70 family RNA polymerase sigma factor n=1 Tax=Nocardia sp. NBC_00511 TaxID=2903591 RepID=UPI0030E3AB36